MHIRYKANLRIVASSAKVFISELTSIIEQEVVVAGVMRSLRNIGESLGALVRQELKRISEGVASKGLEILIGTQTLL